MRLISHGRYFFSVSNLNCKLNLYFTGEKDDIIFDLVCLFVRRCIVRSISEVMKWWKEHHLNKPDKQTSESRCCCHQSSMWSEVGLVFYKPSMSAGLLIWPSGAVIAEDMLVWKCSIDRWPNDIQYDKWVKRPIGVNYEHLQLTT